MSEGAPEAAAGMAQQGGEGQGQPTGEGQGSPQGASPQAGTAEGEEGAADLLGGMMADDPEKLKADVAKWKALARKHEGTAKTNAQKAQEYDALQEANKTELQKAQERAQQAEERAQQATDRHNRVLAAAAHDLPPDLIDYLGTGTPEEIVGRAENISGIINSRALELAKEKVQALGLQWVDDGGTPGSARTAQGAAALAGNGATRPLESMRAGAVPTSQGQPGSKESLFRQMIHDE